MRYAALLAASVLCLVPTGRAEETTPPPELSIDVVAGQKPVQLTTPAAQTRVTREEILTLPGQNDVTLPHLLSETVPGAVSGAQDRLFIRQNEFGVRFEIDGILLPDQPSNALAEPFSPRYIEQLDTLSGSLPAEYGERVSSMVKISTRGSGEEANKPGADAEVAYGSYRSISPEASLWGATSGFRYFLGAAYWRTDRGLGTPDPKSETDQSQGGTDPVHDQAHGTSEFLKLDWTLDNSDRFTLLASNLMAFHQIPNYPAAFRPTDLYFTQHDFFGNDPFGYIPSTTNDTQSEVSDLIEAAWSRKLPGGASAQLGLFYTYYLVQVDNDPANDLAALTAVPASADPNPTSFAENRHVNSLGAQADLTVPLSDGNRAKAGLRTSYSRAVGSLAVTAQDPNATGALLTATDSDPASGVFSGAYLEDELTLASIIKIEAGLRYDLVQYRYADSSPSFDQIEPRLGISVMVTDGTKLHAYYGRLFLPAPIEDLHDVFNGLQAGSFGTYDIKPEKDNYYEIGIDQSLPSKQTLRLSVYYKDATDLLDDAQLLNTSLSQEFNWAHGYAYGVEASLRGQVAEHFTDYLNYGYGVAKGEGLSGGLFALGGDDVPPPNSYQLLDHVQKHTVTAGLTYSRDEGYWATLEALFGSGLPTGPSNSITLPSHFTFNLSAGFRLSGNEWYSGFRVGADLLNVLDNVYPISVANGFNGSYYAPGREVVFRVGKEL